MKYLIFGSVIALFSSVSYAGERPLWEEEPHFLYYRTLCIEGSVSTMSRLIQRAKDNPENVYDILDEIEVEVNNCKRSLGFPNG
jgi:hypothetical protein